jgi:meiotically up-regulated gene 157 (Mug157) protein
MYVYDTLTEAVNGLKQRGYTIDFNVEHDRIVCHKTPVALQPHEFEITEVYRFEGDTDPADEAVVFAIEGKKGENGILVSGYGASDDAVTDEMLQKLRMRRK